MENLYINISTRAVKDSPEECGNTLTIGNLIDLLSDYDEDTPIYLKLDNGASYSPIHFSDMVSNEDKPTLFMLMLLDDFNVTYTALYARDAGDTSVHIQDDIEAYNKLDKIIKDGCNDLIRDFNICRGDMLTSDREVMAFAIVLKKHGLL